MEYSNGFKERMVQRLSGADAVSATALAKEIGVPQPTLSKWLRDASRVSFQEAGANPNGKVTKMPTKRPQDWAVTEKFQAVIESSSLSGEELGAFLRQKGIHEIHLEQWRSLMLEGLHSDNPAKNGAKKKVESREIKQLRRELARKEKALAETAALLVLKKKAQTIWGDEDGPTTRKNGAQH
jgi:transposase-like protein